MLKGQYVNIIGAGLAGCEAAWQAAKSGVKVRLFEMKPVKFTPAHTLDTFAELVCSNSLRSDRLENAVGLLKEEMRLLDSVILRCADETRLPAGSALAVDRKGFSAAVTRAVSEHPGISIITGEVTRLPEEGITVIATGPLTSEALLDCISKLTGRDSLYFYDAAAPVVYFDSIDRRKAFRASRYGKGSDDYINCPMNQEQYELFYNELVNAGTVPYEAFEKEILFGGCMPVESMAKMGRDTLRFGPLKPVGLADPATGEEPWAVVQLRQDNKEGTLYNIVGFQTRLRQPEQKRVFRLIPGLENAEFARYGVMHRNTYINSPELLNAAGQMVSRPEIFFAGQITGVEGYVESAASGLAAGINAARLSAGREMLVFPPETAIGSLAAYVSGHAASKFQPMNASFGLIRAPAFRSKSRRDRYLKIAENSLNHIKALISAEDSKFY